MMSSDEESSFECDVDTSPLIDQKKEVDRGRRCTRRRVVCHGIALFIALMLVFTGLLFLPWFVDFMYAYVIKHVIVLDPNSPIFEEWAHPRMPLYQSMYFFDLQNPDDVINGGRPRVKEAGPYVYKTVLERNNITFHDNGTLSYYLQFRYFFDRERSVGPESDTIATLNVPLMATAHMVKDYHYFVRTAVNGFLYELDESLMIRRSVREILWGYPEPLMTFASQFSSVPPQFQSGQFGYYVGFNETNVGLFNLFNGKTNISLVNHIDKIDGEDRLLTWWSEEANSFKSSTDGSMFHPGVTREETLHLFQPQLCRSVSYEFENESSFKEVPLLKFRLSPSVFMNVTTFPPNRGFCGGQPELCNVPSGVMRQDPCRYGSPIALSNPHYFGGQQTLIDGIEGISPNATLHENYLGVEPKTGVPFVMKFRFQINIFTQPVSGMKDIGDIREMYFPLFWIEQSMEVNDDIINEYKLGFVDVWYAVLAIEWVLFALGIFIILGLVAKTTKHFKRSQEDGKRSPSKDKTQETSPLST
ncbi:scavenger receptor class B member 1-like [Diadema setosum]|uniref:scavenger receptor class B member 1-like n=1 Tax=Diadema setosum TaxID=31175 RepID=UPI003B3B15EC